MSNGKVSSRANSSGRNVMQKTTSRMWMCSRAAARVAILLALAVPLVGFGPKGYVNSHSEQVVLNFEPTAMLLPSQPAAWPIATSPWPPNGTNPSVNGLGATGVMIINPQNNGQTNVQFFLSGARPNTLYTIWTVFKPLTLNWCTTPAATGCPEAFSIAAGSTKPDFNNADPVFQAAFYSEAGAVAPTASMSVAFTSGMGLDRGITFTTDGNGNGHVLVQLDYDLLGGILSDGVTIDYNNGPPVGNATAVKQCAMSAISNGTSVTGPPLEYNPTTCPGATITLPNGKTVKAPNVSFTVTSSWLRQFILQVPNPGDLVTGCANYDPFNPASYFWQCIDPATGMPRVWRFPFDHFRLAAHPDELTHGFIGGSGFEHTIDMVGRRCAITPTPSGC